MLSLQRSIPVPRVRIERIVNYIRYVGSKGSVTTSELRRAGLDFGRGRGDLTRLLAAINVINVTDSRITLTQLGNMIYNVLLNYKEGMLRYVVHRVLYERLPHYRIVFDVVKELREVYEMVLYERANERIKEMTPSSWMNVVAFRAVLGFMLDVGVISRRNGLVVYENSIKREVAKCIEDRVVQLKQYKLITLAEISRCAADALGLEIPPSWIVMCEHVEIIRSPRLDEEKQLVNVKSVDQLAEWILDSAFKIVSSTCAHAETR